MSKKMKILDFFLDGCIAIFPRTFVKKVFCFLGGFLCKTVYRKLWNYNTETVQKILILNPKQASKIAYNSFLNQYNFLVDYNIMAMKSLNEARLLSEKVFVQDREKIKSILDCGRPIIIVSIHMDSFLLGLFRVCDIFQSKRPITAIKFSEFSQKEDLAYSKFMQIGVPIKVLRLTDKPGIESLKDLRNGNILFIFCDIYANWVKTVSISFFGRKAQFISGPAELAIASKALILPLFVYKDSTSKQESHILQIEDVIDPLDFENTSFSEKTLSISQAIGAYVENWVKKHPDQWQMWSVLPSMLGKV